MGTFRGMGQVLHQRAQENPDGRAFVYLLDGESQEQVLTNRELASRARGLARELRESLAVGDRAVLLYPPGLDFVVALYACFYAGIVPVPAYPPDPTRLNRTLPRLQAMLQDAEAKAILTTTGILMVQEAVLDIAPDLENYRWIATDEERTDDTFVPHEAREDEVTLLQYTSGSTGSPKGVVVTHENLVSNAAAIAKAYRVNGESINVSWLPHYHDMGFIVIIVSVFAGHPQVLFSPMDFLQKPARWVNALSKYKATVTEAPNFAYDLAVRKTTPEERAKLDLSSMRTSLNAAEPIGVQTIERFIEAFGPCGYKREVMRPTYGLAEATCFVCTGPYWTSPVIESSTSADGKPVDRVSCGRVLDFDAIIVDPETLVPCKDGETGEVWLRGKGVAKGYWKNETDTELRFRAKLASGEGPFMRTGDLAYKTGEDLFVNGRQKDLIIVRGRNFYPNDIERTIETAISAVRPGCGAAFSVGGEDTESAIVVYEFDPRAGQDPDAVITLIRNEVASTHDLALDAVVLVLARSIPKTSSGKIQRRATRAAFDEGTLEVVSHWRKPQGAPATIPDDGSLRSWIRRWCVENLEVPDVDSAQPLNTYGLTSVTGVALCAALSERAGQRLQAPMLLEYPTIDALCAYLEANAQKGSGDSK